MELSELPFDLLGGLTPTSDTGFTINGVDLAQIYAPASAGTASGITTGFTVLGTDLGTIFAGSGSTTKLLADWKGTYSDAAAGQLTVVAKAFLTFKTDGTYESNYGVGRWLAPNNVASDYEIIAEVTSGTFDLNMMLAYAELNTDRSIELLTSAGPGSGFSQETAQANITIRKIAEPTTKVTGSITFIVNAESYGSTPPP